MALKLYRGPEGESSGPATNLTEPLHSFVGRERELSALRAAFEAEARLVTLIGAPGVGKTRLARELGRRGLAEELFDEVWFCDLMDARTPTHFLTAVGTVLKATRFDDDPEAMLTGLAHLLQGRGVVLLILDNVEQLLAQAAPILGESLRLLPMARLLVTSREPLRLPRETRFTVPPLTLDEAVTLFEERASEVRADFSVPEADREDVRELVESLDRFPLAIELAAARSTVLSPAQIRSRLDERFKLLRDTFGNLPRRQLTLRGALDWSWEMLGPWEREALKQCSVFRGGFTLEAADAVIDLSAYPEAPWTVDMLSALYDRSLLHTFRVDSLPSEVRYGLYASIRDYADEKLSAAEREAVERRHAAWYVAAATRWNQGLDGSDEVGYLARFDADRLNLMAVLGRFEGRDAALTGRTVLALDRFFSIRETFEAQVDLFQRGVRALEDTEERDLFAQIIATRAFHFANRGRTEEARPDLERAEAAVAALPGEPEPATSYAVEMARGVYRLGRSELAEAEAEFARAGESARRMGARAQEGRSLLFLGMVDGARGDTDATRRTEHLERARVHYERSLRIFTEMGSARHQSALLSNIGNLYARVGRRPEQRHYYEAALAQARRIQHRFIEGAILTNLGRLAVEEMRHGDAAEYLEAAVRIQREVGRQNAEAVSLEYAGIMHADQGDWAAAISCFLDAVDVGKAVGHAGIKSEIYFWLGITQLAAGQLADARMRFQACQAEGRETGDASRVALGEAAEAAALALLGETGKAREWWGRAADAEPPAFLPSGARARELLAAIVHGAGGQNGDTRAKARRLVREVNADPVAATPDQRILARVLDRLLTDAAEVQSVEGDVHAAAEAEQLVVGPELAWIRPPGGKPVDLRRRRVLRRLVERLVRERAEAPGGTLSVEDLIEAGWPGQTFVGDSAHSRVYVAIATLRELGLADVLLTRAGGYCLDPHVEMVVRDG